MKIGIWGLYDKGNFGDDLMAIMFAKYLKERNYDVSVFNASENLKLELKAHHFSSIDEFVKHNDVVVIGGGGMLVNNSLIKFLLKRSEFQFERSFYLLHKFLKKYNKKLIPVSIGGANAVKLNNWYKDKLFSDSFTIKGSVRLPSDLKLVNQEIFTYIPDVVLSSSAFFEVKKEEKKGGRKRLVLNLKNKSAGPLIGAFKKAGIFDMFEVYSFHSHAKALGHYGSYEYAIEGSEFHFDTINQGVSFLSNADVVISSKLHVGVTAMSFGGKFISYMGPKKAKEFLNNLNKPENIIDDPKIVVAYLKNFNDKIKDDDLVSKSIEDSYGHFDNLQSIITVLQK